MEEENLYDTNIVNEAEEWLFSGVNNIEDLEVEIKAHTWMGELCMRLAKFKNESDPKRLQLVERAERLLQPILESNHVESFSRAMAESILESF